LKDVDGITVAHRILENKEFKDVPIVLVSGVIEDVEPEKLGLKAFIRKPFRQEDIKKIVSECLSFGPQ
jgi:CheY-like chemotaxis protein